MSRIDLKLEPMHPDGAAGLHFLAFVDRTYRPLLLALGTVLAGMMANRIFYADAQAARLQGGDRRHGDAAGIRDPRTAAGGVLACNARGTAQGIGRLRHGSDSVTRASSSASGCTTARRDEPLLGSADIQSLADLRNGFLVIDGISWVPFAMKNVIWLAVATLIPVAPLLLTTFSVEELLDRVLKVLF